MRVNLSLNKSLALILNRHCGLSMGDILKFYHDLAYKTYHCIKKNRSHGKTVVGFFPNTFVYTILEISKYNNTIHGQDCIDAFVKIPTIMGDVEADRAESIITDQEMLDHHLDIKNDLESSTTYTTFDKINERYNRVMKKEQLNKADLSKLDCDLLAQLGLEDE